MLRLLAYKIKKNGAIYMDAKIDNAADAVLLQRIFRDAAEVHLGHAGGWLDDEKLKQEPLYDYPRKKRFTLVHIPNKIIPIP